MQFTYDNFGTQHATDKAGNRRRLRNRITLRKDGETVVFTREYICKDGSFSSGISTELTNPDEHELAKAIHWGCCGWSAGGHQIWQLTEKCLQFLEQDGVPAKVVSDDQDIIDDALNGRR